MLEDRGGEKILPPSPRKLERAREDGNVAKSQDLSSAAALSAGLFALAVFGAFTLEALIESARYFLGNVSFLVDQGVTLQLLAMRALYFVALAVLPLMMVMVVTGLALNFAQVGFLFTGKPLQPQVNRINPISGFKKFVSVRTFVELVKSLAKLAIVGLIVWLTMRSRIRELLLLIALTPETLLSAVGGLIFSVWWRIAAAMFVLGIFDYAFQRWQRTRDLRMTHQEARQEMKEMEGDPQVRRRVRQLQRQMAMQRMMGEVPEAEVVITNPTEFAVALRYDVNVMSAPTVVAKGARLVAQRIRDVAVEHDVPIVQRPELARTLFRTIEIGQSIPEELFAAVAEVLSFVYQVDRRVEKLREREAFRPAV